MIILFLTTVVDDYESKSSFDLNFYLYQSLNSMDSQKHVNKEKL